MSVMAATICGDKVMIMTDAAFYDCRDGVLLGLLPKVVGIPGIANAAFASRGEAYAFVAFLEACEDCRVAGEWDQLTDQRPMSWLLGCFDQKLRHSGHRGRGAPSGAELMLCGWSRRRNRGEVVFSLHHDGIPGKRGRAYLFDHGHIFRGISDKHVPPPQEFDPVRDGLPAFEAARAEMTDLSCGFGKPVMGRSIGGWIDLTEISAQGAMVRRLGRWIRDVPGLPIMPAISPFELMSFPVVADASPALQAAA